MRKALILLLLVPTILLAQDLIIPKQGNPISAYEVAIGDTYVFYQISLDTTAQTMRIAKDDILMIRKADGTVLNLTESTSAVAAQPAEEVVQEDRFPIVDIENYHGFLLQKGNCVYIPTDSPHDYERAGQEKLKELIQNDGHWQVVDKPEQAHFVLIFYTCLAGQDCAYGVFRTRGEYKNKKTINSNFWVISDVESDFCWSGGSTDETIATNINAAIKLTSALNNSISNNWSLADPTFFCKTYGKKSKEAKAWIIP